MMGRFPLGGSLYGLRVNQLSFGQNLTLIDSTGLGKAPKILVIQDCGRAITYFRMYSFACLNVACRPPSTDVFTRKDGQS
jgi:hypothetical protein